MEGEVEPAEQLRNKLDISRMEMCLPMQVRERKPIWGISVSGHTKEVPIIKKVFVF
jgi:hypothetical protein